MSISKNSYKISVIIINYNSSKHTNNLLKSFGKIDESIDEIIIIDNNSKDVSDLSITKKTKLFKNKFNAGFAIAVNQGILKTKNNLILLINPDCYLENKSIIKSLKLITKDTRIGAIGGKLKQSQNNLYHFTANTKATFLTGLFEFTNLKKLFPNNIYTKKFWIESSYIKKLPLAVESLCGAYIIFKKYLNNKLNLFNTKYFLYLEDIDFGNKINSLGYKVIFDPRSEITHIGGISSNSKYGTVLKYWYKSRKIYFSEHLPKIQSTILLVIFSIEEMLLKIYHFITHTPNA